MRFERREALRFIALLGLFVASVALPFRVASETIRVPRDQPTIEAGINAAVAGDTVMIACGTYQEDLIFLEPGVVVRSETGDPDCVVIDGNDQSIVLVSQFGDASTEILGLTITRGRTTEHGAGMFCLSSDLRITRCIFRNNHASNWGGGLAFRGTSSPRIEDCRFEDNTASTGGGLYCEAGSPEIVNCVFSGNLAFQNGGAVSSWGIASLPEIAGSTFTNNRANWRGGGITCNISSATLTNCTFFSNSASINGAAVHCAQAASAILDHCLIAFNRDRQAVFCTAQSTAWLSCCDVFKNFGGDWDGCILGQANLDGNFSADPLFCDRDKGMIMLQSRSPCAPSGPCGLIGSLEVGCGAIHIEPTSWGAIKSHYR